MIDFPASPATGQLFNGSNGVTYRWTGTIWVATGSSADGDFMATGAGAAAGGVTATLTKIIWDTVKTGNAGGWYSTSTGRFTPPAGRYRIFFEAHGYRSTVATTFVTQLYKNAAPVGDCTFTAAGPAYWAVGVIDVIVDCNGTDYFETWASASGSSNALIGTFSAFPISGIKGPQGDPGAVGSAFDAVLTTNVSIPASTTVSLTGFTEAYDNENTFNPATGIWTPTTAGVYRISAFTSVDSSTAAATVRLHMSSTATGGSLGSCQNVAAGASFTASMATSVVRRVTAGTNYYLQVVTASPVNCTCLGSPYTGFNATYVGP